MTGLHRAQKQGSNKLLFAD